MTLSGDRALRRPARARLRPRRDGRALLLVLLALALGLLVGCLAVVPPASAYTDAPEDYASYEPENACRDRPRAGTRQLAAWIDRTFGGGAALATMRACSSSSSEHQDGRAIDWTMDAERKAQRAEVARFLDRLFADDADGNAHALARRMGIMYLIWNDRIYASYRSFEPRDYLSSSCRTKERCSKTLRHRDHVHVSLSLRGGRGQTSWFTEAP
jgi:hypothetical protein